MSKSSTGLLEWIEQLQPDVDDISRIAGEFVDGFTGGCADSRMLIQQPLQGWNGRQGQITETLKLENRMPLLQSIKLKGFDQQRDQGAVKAVKNGLNALIPSGVVDRYLTSTWNSGNERSSMNFEVKIRMNGLVHYVNVTANSAGQAIALVRTQYGSAVEILGTSRR